MLPEPNLSGFSSILCDIELLSAMGNLDAALATLQCPDLTVTSVEPWSSRIRYAYADALAAAGRTDEAREWFAKCAELDEEEFTDAAERAAQ